MTSLELRGVTKFYGTTKVLTGIDLDVSAGSITTVLGPSGCGKTTLLRLIAGFTRPDSGTISFGKQQVVSSTAFVSPQRRNVGYVAQEGALFPHLNVAANITFGLSRQERRAKSRVEELLALVDLDTALAKRFPHELSGGQQQRVALARALAPKPSIVLLDEPFASLDASLRVGTGKAVVNALRQAGATAVMVTHDQDEALSLADQVAVMREGSLVQVGSPRAVYGQPVDTRVGEFVGEAVILPATISNGFATTTLGRLAVSGDHGDGAASVLIRPEQLQLNELGASGVAARVTEVSYFGHDAAVYLELADTGQPVVARVTGVKAPALNVTVGVAVDGPVLVFNGVVPSSHDDSDRASL